MDWLLVRCWFEYCGAVNGRNDLDACWLIAHDARIPFPLQAMLRSESLARWIQRSFQTTLPAGGRGSIGSCCVGCCYEVETPANACDTGRQTASYFVLGKLPRLGSCSSVDWQPQQSAASRFVGSETGVEKVKRKQLQRTGSQVFAPRKARFPSFHIVCRCVFASFDSSTFWLLSLSALFAGLWFCLLCFTTGYCTHCQKQFVFFACIFGDGVAD